MPTKYRDPDKPGTSSNTLPLNTESRRWGGALKAEGDPKPKIESEDRKDVDSKELKFRTSPAPPLNRFDLPQRTTPGTYESKVFTYDWSQSNSCEKALAKPVPIAPPLDRTKLTTQERHLEFLIKKTKERDRLAGSDELRRWKGPDFELLEQITELFAKVGTNGFFRESALRTAAASFRIFYTCKIGDRIDYEVNDGFETLRKGVLSMIHEACRDSNASTRQQAYRSFVQVSKTDADVMKDNCSFLCRLLPEGHGEEIDVLWDCLAKHLSMSLSDCLTVITQLLHSKRFRRPLLDFLSSTTGRDALAAVLDDLSAEVNLVQRLAPVLPLANTDELGKLDEILSALQGVWVEADSDISRLEKRAARNAGAALLWNLCLLYMVQSKTYDFPDQIHSSRLLHSAATTKLIDAMPAYFEPTIANGDMLFNELSQLTLDQNIPERQSSTDDRAKPKAREYLDELGISARYFFRYLLLEETGDRQPFKEPDTAVQHFTPVQRIAFFRSAANLAARVIFATKGCPGGLGYEGESTVRDIERVTTRAFLSFVRPEDTATVGSGEILAKQAYIILAGEALLVAMHQCETYLATISTNSARNEHGRHLRDRVQALAKLACTIGVQGKNVPTEVIASSEMVLNLSTPQLQMEKHYPRPEWLLQPPPFPPMEMAVDIPSQPRGGGERKRKDGDTERQSGTKRRRRQSEREANSSKTEDDKSLAAVKTGGVGIAIRGSADLPERPRAARPAFDLPQRPKA